MVRRFCSIFILAIILLMFCSCSGIRNKESDNAIELTGNNLKAAWVTTVWNTDFPQKPTANSANLKKEIDELILNAKSYGLNALFFQVRPCADSLFKSNIFPWSRFLTGTQGIAPSDSFDPLSYIIEKSHSAGIQLHAWINPFRITVLGSDKLIPTHPAVLNPELTINVSGKTYFNPGEPRARELIINGVLEILENYEVNGIHFDDYFYPEAITNEDWHTWIEYGNGFGNIADWRRNNVNELVRQTYSEVKRINPNAMFGVSPSGIWANKSSNPLGSDTRGFESYYAIFADSRNWIKSEYVDYIVPQIYWHTDQAGSDFLTVFHWWRDVCKDTNVKLYVGLAGYKLGSGGVWNDKDEFATQMALADTLANGFIVFSFCDFKKI